MAKTSQDPGRREFLKDFVAGTATVGALSAIPVTAWASKADGHERAAPSEVTGPAPRIEYPVEGIETEFMGLSCGTTVGEWSVQHVQAKPGSVAIVLAHPQSQPVQLDVLARGGSISGVVETGALAIFVANGSRGSASTPAAQLAAAGALGAFLRGAERQSEVPADLVSFEQRAQANPRGNFRAI